MATTAQKKAAANRMKAAAKIMKSKTATKAEKASAKRKRDAANKIRTSKTTVKKAIVGKAKVDGKEGKTTKAAKGKNFFGTNIPLSAVADAGKRDEINARLKADIAAGDWSGANDALFSAAFNTVKGGKGQGNPNVGKVHSGEWKVNKSPLSWAETAINSSNDFYPQKDGSVVTFDDKLGSLKDGVSSGTWGGQGTGENNQRSGQAPPPSGVKGAAPINVDASGKQSALRQRGLRDLNNIFGAGTTDVTTGGNITRATGVGATGFGGLMMETDPYRRSAPLDWSDIMPQDTPLQSQQEIISGGGKYYQPWATRQDTPLSLINYDKPRGNIPAVSFIPPGSQVTAAYSGDTSRTTDNNGGVVTAPGEPEGYVPPINPDTGIPFASFMDYTKYMHAKNQGLLQDSTLASTPSGDTLLGVNTTPSASNTNLLTYSNPVNPASVAGRFPVAPVNAPATTVNTAIPRYLTEPIYPYNPYQAGGVYAGGPATSAEWQATGPNYHLATPFANETGIAPLGATGQYPLTGVLGF